MQNCLNWKKSSSSSSSSSSQFEVDDMNRKRIEQERRREELMEFAKRSSFSSTATTRTKAVPIEKDWTGSIQTRSQRRHVESKHPQNGEHVSNLLMHSDLVPTSISNFSGPRKKQFSNPRARKSAEIDLLTGPGGYTKNNASSWKTSSQIQQSGTKTDVPNRMKDRRTSRATVTSNVSGQARRTTQTNSKNLHTLFSDQAYDNIASAISSRTTKKNVSSSSSSSRPLPGYTGRRAEIEKPRHHDKSVSVGFHPFGSSYSGKRF